MNSFSIWDTICPRFPISDLANCDSTHHVDDTARPSLEICEPFLVVLFISLSDMFSNYLNPSHMVYECTLSSSTNDPNWLHIDGLNLHPCSPYSQAISRQSLMWEHAYSVFKYAYTHYYAYIHWHMPTAHIRSPSHSMRKTNQLNTRVPWMESTKNLQRLSFKTPYTLVS